MMPPALILYSYQCSAGPEYLHSEIGISSLKSVKFLRGVHEFENISAISGAMRRKEVVLVQLLVKS